MTHTHTPGQFPLYAENIGEQFTILTNQGNLYAKTFDPCAARLIAAAPDLLEALQMLSSIEPSTYSETCPYERGIWEMAKDAIAKATGKGDA